MTLTLSSGELRALRDAVYATLQHTEQAYAACGDRKARKQLSLERKRLAALICKLEQCRHASTQSS